MAVEAPRVNIETVFLDIPIRLHCLQANQSGIKYYVVRQLDRSGPQSDSIIVGATRPRLPLSMPSVMISTRDNSTRGDPAAAGTSDYVLIWTRPALRGTGCARIKSEEVRCYA